MTPRAPGLVVISFDPEGSPQPAANQQEVADALLCGRIRSVRSALSLGRARLRWALRRACCHGGQSVLRAAWDPGERNLVTVVAMGGDWRLVEVIGATADLLHLRVELVGLAPPSPAAPFPDVLESSGPAGLARKFAERTGDSGPDWDVLHGRSPARTLAAYVGDRRPRMVAVPHRAHRPWRRCDALRLVRRVPTAVLVVGISSGWPRLRGRSGEGPPTR